VDTVILAAGRNERLNGLVPAGHKPLLVVNGMPLIGHAVRQGAAAIDFGKGDRVIVVASPENAHALHQVLPPDIYMIIQRFPEGPGDALLIGLTLSLSSEVLVLMGDNYTSDQHVENVRECEGNVVGVGEVALELCERFTRWRSESIEDPSKGTWVEKVPVDPRRDLWKQDGHGPPYALAWLGPLKLRVDDIRRALQECPGQQPAGRGIELQIGPAFNCLPDVSRVPVTSIDLGIPEVLP
jgi:MobA-like NTP transferase domain